MGLSAYTDKLLGIARTLSRWAGSIAALEQGRRTRVAHYAGEVAATLARASEALSRLEHSPADRAAAVAAARELGRIAGYVETIVCVLTHHLDGRKLAGVKRRLEYLERDGVPDLAGLGRPPTRIERLIAAEGYFRALADALRT